jgi:hypothetical protein
MHLTSGGQLKAVVAGEVDQASGCVLDLRLPSDVISRQIIGDVGCQGQREASVCRAFPWGLPTCSLQVTLRSMQWRGSGGPGLAAITLTRAWAWS